MILLLLFLLLFFLNDPLTIDAMLIDLYFLYLKNKLHPFHTAAAGYFLLLKKVLRIIVLIIYPEIRLIERILLYRLFLLVFWLIMLIIITL